MKKDKISFNYELKYSDDSFDYAIEKSSFFDGTEMYYTSVRICKLGISFMGLMSKSEKGFKTVEGAKAHIRTVLLQKCRNTLIEKDIANLPIFCGSFQTAFKF